MLLKLIVLFPFVVLADVVGPFTCGGGRHINLSSTFVGRVTNGGLLANAPACVVPSTPVNGSWWLVEGGNFHVSVNVLCDGCGHNVTVDARLFSGPGATTVDGTVNGTNSTCDQCVDGCDNCGGATPILSFFAERGRTYAILLSDFGNYTGHMNLTARTVLGCADGQQNGTETAVDCGGSCPPCSVGSPCNATADCSSHRCSSAAVCLDSTCDDGVHNGNESDVDCGGGACPPCPTGASCLVDSDCAAHDNCTFTSGGAACERADCVLCPPPRTCVSDAGVFICACPSGFVFNGSECVDVNECDGSGCGAYEDCLNSDGSFSCSCQAGYVSANGVCEACVNVSVLLGAQNITAESSVLVMGSWTSVAECAISAPSLSWQVSGPHGWESTVVELLEDLLEVVLPSGSFSVGDYTVSLTIGTGDLNYTSTARLHVLSAPLVVVPTTGLDLYTSWNANASLIVRAKDPNMEEAPFVFAWSCQGLPSSGSNGTCFSDNAPYIRSDAAVASFAFPVQSLPFCCASITVNVSKGAREQSVTMTVERAPFPLPFITLNIGSVVHDVDSKLTIPAEVNGSPFLSATVYVEWVITYKDVIVLVVAPTVSNALVLPPSSLQPGRRYGIMCRARFRGQLPYASVSFLLDTLSKPPTGTIVVEPAVGVSLVTLFQVTLVNWGSNVLHTCITTVNGVPMPLWTSTRTSFSTCLQAGSSVVVTCYTTDHSGSASGSTSTTVQVRAPTLEDDVDTTANVVIIEDLVSHGRYAHALRQSFALAVHMQSSVASRRDTSRLFGIVAGLPVSECASRLQQQAAILNALVRADVDVSRLEVMAVFLEMALNSAAPPIVAWLHGISGSLVAGRQFQDSPTDDLMKLLDRLPERVLPSVTPGEPPIELEVPSDGFKISLARDIASSLTSNELKSSIVSACDYFAVPHTTFSDQDQVLDRLCTVFTVANPRASERSVEANVAMSPAVALSFFDPSTTNKVNVSELFVPIQIALPRKDVPLTEASCKFWDEMTDNWSSEGCAWESSSSEYTHCLCDHLTYFSSSEVYVEEEETSATSLVVPLVIAMMVLTYFVAMCLARSIDSQDVGKFRIMLRDALLTSSSSYSDYDDDFSGMCDKFSAGHNWAAMISKFHGDPLTRLQRVLLVYLYVILVTCGLSFWLRHPDILPLVEATWEFKTNWRILLGVTAVISSSVFATVSFMQLMFTKSPHSIDGVYYGMLDGRLVFEPQSVLLNPDLVRLWDTKTPGASTADIISPSADGALTGTTNTSRWGLWEGYSVFNDDSDVEQIQREYSSSNNTLSHAPKMISDEMPRPRNTVNQRQRRNSLPAGFTWKHHKVNQGPLRDPSGPNPLDLFLDMGVYSYSRSDENFYNLSSPDLSSPPSSQEDANVLFDRWSGVSSQMNDGEHHVGQFSEEDDNIYAQELQEVHSGRFSRRNRHSYDELHESVDSLPMTSETERSTGRSETPFSMSELLWDSYDSVFEASRWKVDRLGNYNFESDNPAKRIRLRKLQEEYFELEHNKIPEECLVFSYGGIVAAEIIVVALGLFYGLQFSAPAARIWLILVVTAIVADIVFWQPLKLLLAAGWDHFR